MSKEEAFPFLQSTQSMSILYSEKEINLQNNYNHSIVHIYNISFSDNIQTASHYFCSWLSRRYNHSQAKK